jgi:small basic protein (TIGR04137 family)
VSGNTLKRHRNVFTRAERMIKMEELNKWREGMSVFAMPKMKGEAKLKKNKGGGRGAKKKEEAAAAATAATTAAAPAAAGDKKGAAVDKKAVEPKKGEKKGK